MVEALVKPVVAPAFDAEKLDEDFRADGVRFRLRLPAARLGALADHLRDATRDRARVGDPLGDP